MYTSDSVSDQAQVIAVVGAGASGTLTVVHLLREARARGVPLRVALIDRHDRHGRGQAYSTTHPAHLLNAPASAMSAVSGDPGHLVRWAEQAGISHDGFLPRRAYGTYLSELLAEAERTALPAARVSHLASDVVALRRSAGRRALRLDLAAGGRIDADVAVLAIGNLPSAPPCPISGDKWFIADPWEPGALDQAADGRPVVAVGSGHTMIDVAIALTDRHPGATVQAISRHGLLPLAHTWPAAPARAAKPALPRFGKPVRLAGLIRDVRRCAAEYPGDWQDVVDSLRPHVPGLWEQLPDADKQLFLRHVARYWEVHRHRLPPATARRARLLRASGRLSAVLGRVVAATGCGHGVRVSVEMGQSSRADLTAGWLINCTGPGADIRATGQPLLRDLFDRGLARPDPTLLGLHTDASGAVLDSGGRPASDLFALGPLLRGLRYETTAVPEIRDQAAALANILLAREAHLRPRTAA